jgi:hypothetical protein
MSGLGFDDNYSRKLRKTLKEFDNPVEANKTQPEMFFRQAQSDFILPYSKPAYPTLALALKAERQITEAQGQDEGMEGGNIFKDVGKMAKKSVKSVKKAAQGIEKGAKKVARSKVVKGAVKGAKKVGKAVGTAVLDEAEKASGVAGATLGSALAVAVGQPELAPIAGVIGEKVAKDLGKQARKAIKEKTGMGKPRPPSKWIMHVKQYAKDNGVSYKEAMRLAKDTYKK